MGDPKKQKKTYQTPSTPWSKSRIEEEAVLRKDYGFKTKTEIWKVSSKLRRYARKAKELIAAEGKQAELETQHLLGKLATLGLVEPNSQLDKVLDLGVETLFDRRLQTQVFKKGLARTVKQARQLITHRHILVGEKVIASPSHLVTKKEEALIRFVPASPFAQPDHPERVIVKADKSENAEKPAKAEIKKTENKTKIQVKENEKPTAETN